MSWQRALLMVGRSRTRSLSPGARVASSHERRWRHPWEAKNESGLKNSKKKRVRTQEFHAGEAGFECISQSQS